MEQNVLEDHLAPPPLVLSYRPQRLCNLREKFVLQLQTSLLLLSCRRRRCHLVASGCANPSSLRRRHCRFRVAISVAAVMLPLLPPIQFCASDFAFTDVFLPPYLPSRCFCQANPSLFRLRCCVCRLAAISLPTIYHHKFKFMILPLILYF